MTQHISKEDALRAYARMMHNLSADYLEPLLADDVHYSSAWGDRHLHHGVPAFAWLANGWWEIEALDFCCSPCSSFRDFSKS